MQDRGDAAVLYREIERISSRNEADYDRRGGI